ncbi:hypothetical protein N657DRAFT_86481 [Parathielavia appendiculata]|uniref:DH domain-containing protein n=1 Tax=Parathielavia appendiculata TaxID=2587402 RepID=A0AAN6UBH2_9PEZI|nr:hypothetical protein N657DRAFT_86481 [Parathielavia appendiculata]
MMRSADVDHPRPPSLNGASCDMTRGAEQPEDADPAEKPADDEGKAGSALSAAMYALKDVPSAPLDQAQEADGAQGFVGVALQADHLRRHPSPRSARPFKHWIRTLHRRALRRQDMLGYDGSLPQWLKDTGDVDDQTRQSSHHRHSSSDSSFAFVTAVKSASVSVAGVSLLTRSWKTTIRSSRGPRTERSRRASLSGPRVSEDSCCPERQLPLDPAVTKRAVQRRRILEELISSEEDYIGDVRFLMNVYVTILASLPSSPAGLRPSVNQNLTDIVELHEEILGELHRAVPDSEYTQLDLPIRRTRSNPSTRGHFRWRSLDAVPEGKEDISWLREVPGMMAEPSTAAEVSKIFLKKMNRFFIYEEYGAKYEMMIKNVAAAHQTMPGWLSYQKGLEVLASSLGSADSRDNQSRKALTTGDLLVKPIQRVCKYPLLFSELLKYTPVIDCPYSHVEIENTLIRLREATAEINRATNDCRTKSVLEKTWILQDRLAFPNHQVDAASKSRIRSFGHIQLCGALHVCWQTKEGVSGQYMVALLYREWFCLATAGRIDQIYTIRACIALGNIKVEEADNGRGLQCHTARYSWKIVFLSNNQLYELILTACSPKEELEWCARLNNQGAATPDGQERMQSEMSSFLSLNVKSLGTVFRKPGTIARKISIHRATTIGPKSPLYQVILKNTSAAKDLPTSSSSSSSQPSSLLSPSSSSSSNAQSQQINRSQSLLTTNSRIPVLAPARAERARLEALLTDVWTRDVLPFPGIAVRSRSEQLASSMMRKLSAVSIAAGGFSRRSTSLASLHYQKEKEKEKEKAGAGAAPGVSGSSGGKDTGFGGLGERKRQRRISEGEIVGCVGRTVPVPVVEDTYSASASRAEHQACAREACPDIARRASAPEVLGEAPEPEKNSVTKLREAGAKKIDPRGSWAPCLGSEMSMPKSLGNEGSATSSREGSKESRPGRCEMGDAGKVVQSRKLEERRSASSVRGARQRLSRGQGRGIVPTRSRSRSQGLAGKLVKTELKRREVVVEEIRSWFR